MEITNLNVKLQNNPYGSYILPLIQYFNAPHTRPTNPFEAVAIVNILNGRLLNWNIGAGSQPAQGLGIDKCCCPATTLSGSNCTWCAKPPQEAGPSCCKECDQLGEDPIAASAGSPPLFTVPEFLRIASTDQNLADPYTPAVKKFEKEIDGMVMTAPNAWVYMQQMIDVFYENVAVIEPFMTDLYAGTYLDVITSIISNGGGFRDGYKATGLGINTITESGTPIVGAKAVTSITCSAITETIASGLEGPLVSFIAAGGTRRYIAWFNLDNEWNQPNLSTLPGITDVYIPIVTVTTETASTLANKLHAALVGAAIPGVETISITTFTTVNILLDTEESVIASTISEPWPIGANNGFTTAVTMTFQNGAAPSTGETKTTRIDYKDATVNSLVGQWFKLYAAADDGILFYYETPSQPINPALFGTSFTTAVAINAAAGGGCYQAVGGVSYVCPPKSTCIAGECIYNVEGIEQLTSEAIVNTGLFERSSGGGCWVRNGNNGGNSETWTDPCPTSAIYSALVVGTYPDADGGTVQKGLANQVNQVISPDGTVYGTAEDDLTYARIWNNQVVPEMKGKGKSIYYLKPVRSYGRGCVCCCEDQACLDLGCDCRQCVFPDTKTIASLMIQTPFPSITEDLKFNTPGSGFRTTS